MTTQYGKIVSGGRLQLPAELRRELGLVDGDSVRMEVVDNELRIRSQRESIRRVQERLRHLRPKDGSFLSDELIADRRREAENE